MTQTEKQNAILKEALEDYKAFVAKAKMGSEAALELYEHVVALNRIAESALGDSVKSAEECFSRINALEPMPETKFIMIAMKMAAVSLLNNDEPQIQGRFFDRLDEFLPGAKRVSVKNLPLDRPDGFVEYHGFVCPVEVKRHQFDRNAKDQLRRYMRAYDSRKGIAVAPKLTALLPPDMIFVEVSRS
jgi:hypothetical protein